MIDLIFNALAALLMSGIVLWLLLTWQFLDYLRVHQPDTFARIGRPHLLFNNSPRITFRVVRYILSRSEWRSANGELQARLRTLHRILWGYLGLLALLLTAVLLIVLFGTPANAAEGV